LKNRRIKQFRDKEKQRSSPLDWLEQSWLLRMPEILNQGSSCTRKAAAGKPRRASREKEKSIRIGKGSKRGFRALHLKLVTKTVTCSWTKG